MMEQIGLVILAAGRSVRMGRPKLLLPLQGQPLLEHTLQTAAAFSWGGRVAVIGEPREFLEPLCQSYGFATVYNAEPERGQGHSLRLGIKTLTPEIKGLIFLPGDQPLVSGELLNILVGRFIAADNYKTIVVPCHDGHNCSPALFGCGWFDDLSQIEGDRGGREIIRENPEVVKNLGWPDYRDFLDVDTEADYENICKELVRDGSI